MLLCPAPVIQKGLKRHSGRVARNNSWPCQKGTTSSCVPCITKTGHRAPPTLSTFGKRSPGSVYRKSKAMRNTERIGDWSTTPAGGVFIEESRSARYNVGPLPTLRE